MRAQRNKLSVYKYEYGKPCERKRTLLQISRDTFHCCANLYFSTKGKEVCFSFECHGTVLEGFVSA